MDTVRSIDACQAWRSRYDRIVFVVPMVCAQSVARIYLEHTANSGPFPRPNPPLTKHVARRTAIPPLPIALPTTLHTRLAATACYPLPIAHCPLPNYPRKSVVYRTLPSGVPMRNTVLAYLPCSSCHCAACCARFIVHSA
jgi:hypothetical protein